MRQSNTATANADTALATTTGSDNLDLTVLIPSVLPVVVGDSWVWDWNWGSGPPPTSSAAAPTSSAVWTWNWGTPTATQSAPDTPVAGHWIWTWTWTRGDGWSQTLTTDQPCSCSWLWDWTWAWDAPAATDPTHANTTTVALPDATLAATADQPQVSQSNEANATATATADLDAQQTVDSTGTEDADGPATQVLASAQNADAQARAEQVDVLNSSWVSSGTLASIAQANTIDAEADASAELDAVQAIVQSRQRTTDDDVALSMGATQSIASSQDAQADAEGVQHRVFNISAIWSQAPSTAPIGAISQSNDAQAAASAAVSGSVEQLIVQMQVEAGAAQDAVATQSVANSQSADAAASAAQSDTGNVNDVEIPAYGVYNPAVTTSNTASASSLMTDQAAFSQDTLQAAAGENIEWHEVATQEGRVMQSGNATSSQAQVLRVNRTAWSGPIVFPSAPEAAAAAPAPAVVEAAAVEAPVVTDTVAFQRRKPFWSPPGGTAPRAKQPKLVITTFGLRLATPEPEPAALPSFFAPSPFAPSAASQAPASTTAIAFSNVHDPSFDGPDSTAAVSRGGSERQPCPQCEDGFMGGAIMGSAQGPSSGGVLAALEPFRIFAAPGVGRPLPAAPALGLPVDLAPPERPG